MPFFGCGPTFNYLPALARQETRARILLRRNLAFE
jgi:hypothetical protein